MIRAAIGFGGVVLAFFAYHAADAFAYYPHSCDPLWFWVSWWCIGFPSAMSAAAFYLFFD
jgi:hypothetical protein|tara:strand:- start:138 stop:317 length:180 start_codon:yes stop_codon:yes gene_type:complete